MKTANTVIFSSMQLSQNLIWISCKICFGLQSTNLIRVSSSENFFLFRQRTILVPLASTAAVLSQCWNKMCQKDILLFFTFLDHIANMFTKHFRIICKPLGSLSSEILFLVFPDIQGKRVIIKWDSIHGYVGECVDMFLMMVLGLVWGFIYWNLRPS